MKESKKCPKCGSTDILKGHQELFPSTFMEDVGVLGFLTALRRSKEFDIYACANCGYSEWYIRKS